MFYFLSTHPGEVAAVLTAFSWSVAVVFFRLAGENSSSLAFNLFKSAFATVLFFLILPFAEWGQMTSLKSLLFPVLTQKEWVLLTVSGILGVTLGDLFFLMAIKRIGASLNALISCIYSPLVMLFAFLFLDETMPLIGVIGGAFVVTAVIVAGNTHSIEGVDRNRLASGIFYAVLSEIAMVAAVIMIRDIFREQSVYWVLSFRFFVGTFFMLPLLLSKKVRTNLKSMLKPVKQRNWIILGSLFGPFLATILWLLGFKYTLAGKAAVYNQLSTIFIFILAAIFLKEKLTTKRVIALILGVFGAVLVSL